MYIDAFVTDYNGEKKLKRFEVSLKLCSSFLSAQVKYPQIICGDFCKYAGSFLDFIIDMQKKTIDYILPSNTVFISRDQTDILVFHKKPLPLTLQEHNIVEKFNNEIKVEKEKQLALEKQSINISKKLQEILQVSQENVDLKNIDKLQDTIDYAQTNQLFGLSMILPIHQPIRITDAISSVASLIPQNIQKKIITVKTRQICIRGIEMTEYYWLYDYYM